MNLIVGGIIILTTFLNISSYFILATRTPQFTVFLGTVHYPMDYLDYLAFITQGKNHWFLSYHVFTGETTKLELLNWIYTFGGHMGSFFHLTAPVTYQVLVVVASAAYLYISYRLAAVLFPTNKTTRLISYILFLLSNEFPRIYSHSGTWIFTYLYPWNNIGEPLERLSNVPHHVFIQFGIMAAFVGGISYWLGRKNKSLIALAILGCFVSSMQPLQWALVTGVLGVSGLFAWWQTKTEQQKTTLVNQGLFAFLPSVVFFLSGLPVAIYLKHLYTLVPYDYTLIWEATQQVRITIIQFIILNGPLMVLAILAIPFVVKKITIREFPVIFYSVFVIAVFFSPIPDYAKILNLRFLSVIPTFAFAYLATWLIWLVASKVDPKRKIMLTWFLSIVAISITIPVTANQFYSRMFTVGPTDVNAYLPLGAYQTYEVAEKVVGPTETVLVEPLFSDTFAGLTGKHVFVSNEFATINYARKIKEATDFYYSKQLLDSYKVGWLKENKISYIFTYAWVPIYLPNLTVVYQNQYAIFYKVTNAK